jgi:hypothetical protein
MKTDPHQIKLEPGSLLCVELATLGSKLEKVRSNLNTSPQLYASFRSLLGDGLNAVFRVSPDKTRRRDSFRAIERHVLDLTGIQISKTALLVDTFAYRGARILVDGRRIQF